MAHVIEKTATNVFMSLTVGGGIRSLEDARRAFNAGADKVSVNTAALRNHELVNDIAKRFGSQACMVAIDAKRRYLRSEEDARKAIEDFTVQKANLSSPLPSPLQIPLRDHVVR
jgi:cyclase